MKNAKSAGHVAVMNDVSQWIEVRIRSSLQTVLILHPFQFRPGVVNIHRREYLSADISHTSFKMRHLSVREKSNAVSYILCSFVSNGVPMYHHFTSMNITKVVIKSTG